MFQACAAFEVPPPSDVHHRLMVGLGDDGRRSLLQEEGEVEHVGDRHLAGHRVQRLRRDPDLHVVALGEADLRVEVEHGADLHRRSEQDVVHVKDCWSRLAEDEGVGPGKLEGLSHDVAAEDLAVDVAIVRLAYDHCINKYMYDDNTDHTWHTIKFFRFASSNQAELSGFTRA